VALLNDRFLRACRREPVDVTPVWFMRQAGRYMKEYRAVREKAGGIIELCKNTPLCTEVTLQPVEHIGVDAAILFADILLPLEPMGAPFHFAAGEGPVIESPLRTRADVARLRAVPDAEGLGYVLDAIRSIRTALAGRVPLIGFAGAPFTLASYLIEGGSQKGGEKTFALTRGMMTSDPEAWHELMDKLTRTISDYVRAQVAAGAQVIQLFDSWVGCLKPREYQEMVLPYSSRILHSLDGLGVPRIHFGVGTLHLLTDMGGAGAEVMGVDFKTPMEFAMKVLGPQLALQGNLDPQALLGPRDALEAKALAILDTVGGRRGHIFNLGHGIEKETDPSVVRDLVAFVHEKSAGRTK
jgi:uroporphyrinogen decarboxylase